MVTVTSASNANDQRASVCVQAGSSANTTLSLSYPAIKLVPVYSSSPGDVLAGRWSNVHLYKEKVCDFHPMFDNFSIHLSPVFHPILSTSTSQKVGASQCYYPSKI